MSHSLVEIPYSEWPRLRDLYSGHRKCTTGFTLIRNFTNCLEREPGQDVKIYALDGDWENDGLFILEHKISEVPIVFLNTLSNNFERLGVALDCLDRATGKLFFAVEKRLMPTLLKITDPECDATDINETIWFHLEREKALQFDVEPPPGVVLLPVSVKHAESINSVWPHRSSDSVKYVEWIIKFYDNVGAFDKNGNLVAWCLSQQIGSLALLQVADTHRKQGLGSLVVRYMARHIALKGEEVLSPVNSNNVASRNLFEKLGFRQIDTIYWPQRPAK